MKSFKNKTKMEEIVADLLNDLASPEIGKKEHLLNRKAGQKEKATQESSTDGLLALQNGKLELIPPKKGGNWPVIDAGENVIIKVGEKIITSPTLVNNIDEVEIEVLHHSPHSKFAIELSPDEMQVVLETIFIPGKRYSLVNLEPQHKLKVQVNLAESISPEPVEEKLVYQKIKELGVTVDINTEAVRMLCNSPVSTRAIVAAGKPATPPVDGWIQYLFDADERLLKVVKEEESIDFFDKGVVNSVEAGKVLAVLHPPVLGKPGLTATGKFILPPAPKTVEIQVGKGVKLSKDGQAAIAALNGRPTLTERNKIISMVSQLVIPGDVDISTGHIRFKGDVVILGDVAEGLVVEAGGKVDISGSVYRASIYGEAGVTIKKGLIGGLVCAGGEAARYRRVLPKLERIAKSLEAVGRAFEQVKNNRRFSTEDLKLQGEGPLIKLILEMRFPQIGKILEEIQQMSPGEKESEQGVWKVFDLMAEKLVGLGPLSIKSIDEVAKFQAFTEKVMETIRESLDTPAHVIVGHCQNSQVEATGNVLIFKDGMYHSKIFAGDEIIIKSVCRGGELYAPMKIIAKELGSETGAQTLAGVDEQGEVKAERIFPGVLLRFGTIFQKNQKMLKWAVLYCHDGLIQDSF